MAEDTASQVGLCVVLLLGAVIAFLGMVLVARTRATRPSGRLARLLTLLCLLSVGAWLVYVGACGMAYSCLTRTCARIQTVHTRDEVLSVARLYTERVEPSLESWSAPAEAGSVYSYSLLGLRPLGLVFHVAYDEDERVLVVYETYE